MRTSLLRQTAQLTLLAGLLLAAPFAARADSTKKEFQLKDGTTIQAEILSYKNGVYELKSDALGRISLSEDKIRNIQYGAQSAPPANPSSPGNPAVSQAEIQQKQQQMMNDPESMRLIKELQNDPQIDQILNDQDLMKAINQGDVGRVSADPKVQALQNNQKINQLLQQQLR